MAAQLREVDEVLELGITSGKAHSCREVTTRAYWRYKLPLLYTILRAENTVIAFVHPQEKELVYFSRFQRVACYATEIFMSFMVRSR